MTPTGVNRKWVGTVLVVLLVVLAGCTGGGGGDGGGADGASDGADSSGGSSGSSGSGGSGGSSGSGGSGGSGSDSTTSSDGSSGSGDATDGGGDAAGLEDSYDEYASNLRELGSYTASYTWTTEGADGETNSSFQGVVRADLEAESAYMVQTVVDESGETTTIEIFWPEGEDSVYTRYDVGDSAFYQKAPREQSMLTLWTDPVLGSGSVPSAGTNPSSGSLGGYSDEGIVSTAEGPRHKYVIDDLTAASVEGSSGGEVTDYYSEILVDEERGIVTDYLIQVEYAGTNETAGIESFTFELTYRDIGSTTVPTPEWLSEAKAQTG